MKAIPTMFKYIIKEKRKLFLPPMKDIAHMELTSKFAMHLVRHGQIEQSYLYQDLSERPDYGKFIFHLESQQQARYESPHVYMPHLKKLFPDLREIFRFARSHKQLQYPSSKDPAQCDHPEAGSPATLEIPLSARSSSSSSSGSRRITLHQVLDNAWMRNYFKAFLSNLFSVELVLFLEEVNIYRALCRVHSTPSSQNLEQELQIPATEMTLPEKDLKGSYIVEHFLSEQGLFEVNTSQVLVGRVVDRLRKEGYVEELFDEIVGDVKMSLLIPLFPSFEQSKLCEDMMIKLTHANNKL